MPLLPAIGLGLSAAQTILNPVLQNSQNQRNREFTKEMYSRQRADALSDWERQNAYNSPQQQMQRLKEAGLNPHLIYGSGATATGGDVKATSSHMAPSKVPEIDTSPINNSIMAIYETQQRQNAMDLQREAMETADIQQELLQAQVVKTLADAAGKETDTGMRISMFPTNLEIALKKLEGLQADNARKWQSLEQSEKSFPVKIANELLRGAKIAEDIKTSPVVRRKLEQDIAASITQQSLTELKKLSEQQQQVLFNEIQQSKIWQNKLSGIRMTQAEQQVELNRIKIGAKGTGLSEQALSDIIRSIIGVRISK